MKKGKLIFITAVAVAVCMGIGFYVQKHGFTDATSVEIGISAGQALLMDADTGEVLYEKCADQKAYPASTTKIMTALVTLETMEEYDSPLEQKVRVPEVAEGVEGSSIYLKAGEEISVQDLLYGLMLVSGNDAAVALAEIIGGDQEHFVEMMNNRAAELGCSSTHFANPNGLFDEDHYTTARDLAVISAAAMKNGTFREIVSTVDWKAEREESTYLTFHNKNKTITEFEGGSGIKIGYTKDSGRTLAASAERDGRTMIAVVMSAPDWFNDAYRLMEFGFRQ